MINRWGIFLPSFRRCPSQRGAQTHGPTPPLPPALAAGRRLLAQAAGRGSRCRRAWRCPGWREWTWECGVQPELQEELCLERRLWGAAGVSPTGHPELCSGLCAVRVHLPRRPGQRGWGEARPWQPEALAPPPPWSGNLQRRWRRENEQRIGTDRGKRGVSGQGRGGAMGSGPRRCRPHHSRPIRPWCHPYSAGLTRLRRKAAAPPGLASFSQTPHPPRLRILPPDRGERGRHGRGSFCLGLPPSCGCQQLAEPSTRQGCKLQARGGRSHPSVPGQPPAARCPGAAALPGRAASPVPPQPGELP